MNIVHCLRKYARELKEFDTAEVVEAGRVYHSRGLSEAEANASAIDDHLRELHAERDRINADILAKWASADPKGYAKAIAKKAEAAPAVPQQLPKESQDGQGQETRLLSQPEPAPAEPQSAGAEEERRLQAQYQSAVTESNDPRLTDGERKIAAARVDEILNTMGGAKSVSRTKNGKLEVSGFDREDVAESLKTAKIKATIAVGQDGKILVSMVGRDGNHMPMPAKQAKAIETALMGKTARAPKPRKFTGNLRNDVNIIAPGLYAEVSRGGDGEGLAGFDMSLIAEQLKAEGFMLPATETGKDSDAVIELIRQDIANGGGTLNEARQMAAMTEAEQKAHRADVLRLANEYGVETKRGVIPRPLADIEAELKVAIEEEIGIAGESLAAAREQAISQGVPAEELDAIMDQIADFYDRETSPDKFVLMYREAANQIQERIDGNQEQQGRDGQGQGAVEYLPSGAGSESRPALELTGQTEAEIRAEEDRLASAEAQRLQEEQEAERKRRADAERGDFRLTGSTSKADVLEAYGQGGLFDQPAAAPEKQPAAPVPTSQGYTSADNANTDATLARTRDRSEVRFSTPYVGTTGAKLVGYVWPNKKEEYVDNRGEDRVRTVSDWEHAVENLETGRQIVHQFFIQKPDDTEQQVSAETAATLLGISEGAVRANARKLLEREIQREKARIAAIAGADKVDAIPAADSPAAAVDGGVVFEYALNAPMIQRMQAKGKNWQDIDDRIERESASRETYRFMERDGKYIWTPEIVSEGSELSRRGWKTVELRAMEIWPGSLTPKQLEMKARAEANKTPKQKEMAARAKESAIDAALRSVGVDPNAPADEAKTLRREAEKLQREAREMLDRIPPGQPVSSTRDRNLREKSAEKSRKAAELFDRADAIDAQKVGAGETATDEESSVTGKSRQIEDFGEKIGGARKDVWSGFKDQIGEIPDDEIANQPFSKAWPAPDYQAMLDSGADPWAVAFIHAARDEVPAKPRAPYKVKRWAESVKLLRGMTTKILSGEYSVETVREKLSEQKNGLQKLASRVELYELVGHSKSLEGISFARHHYSIYRGREDVTLWAVEKAAKATAWSNWPTELATGDTKEEMLAAFKAKHAELNSEKAKSKEASFDIYSQGGEYFVGKKIGRNIMQLAGPFKTVKEARDHRITHQEELSATLEKRKEIPQERRDTNNPRVGEDMRGGQDVTQQMFGEAFGFRGVEFGNWVEQGKRQSDLNEAYDALMDMAAILGVPPKALSLNGQLGLAFGARGTGGIHPAKAHYEADKVVINLTKKEGAGSLGHEWWHALDNYFSRIRAKSADFMTEALDVSLASRDSEFIANTAVRKEMVAAFGKVIRAINGTALKARASKLDAKRTKEYWTTGPEMSARAFESYLISKLQDQNASNDYLANIVDEETWKAAEALGFELDDSYPYPTAGEVPAIREAFDNFFRVVETRETDKGIAFNSIEPRQTKAVDIEERRDGSGYPLPEFETAVPDDLAQKIIVAYNRSAISPETKLGRIEDSEDIGAKTDAFRVMAEAEGYTVGGVRKYLTLSKNNGVVLHARLSDHANVNRGVHFGEAMINIAPGDGRNPIDTFASALFILRNAAVDENGDTVILQPITGTFDSANPSILNDLSTDRNAAITRAIDRAIAMEQGKDVAPLKRQRVRNSLAKLRADLEAGKITEPAFVAEVENLHAQMEIAFEAKRLEPHKGRERGADWIRQKLLEAKRRGDISEEAAKFAEWFVLKNPALVEDLGISLRTKQEGQASGNYNPATRVMTLLKGRASDTTAVHEILHHLERMMPAEMQAAIRKEWLQQATKELNAAIKAKDQKRIAYFEAVLAGDQKTATEILTGEALDGLNSAVQDSVYGLPDQSSGHRTLDAATLADLRREAAGLEQPEQGKFLTVTEDGRAITYGEPRTRIPASFARFAEKHGLAFEARRVVAGGTKHTYAGNSERMPIEYRADGAMYFGEMGRYIDRTGRTRYDLDVGRDYRYLNPSEFWAVSMTETVAARFKAKDSIWSRSLQWLREALEHIKAVLGLNSRHPLIKALDVISQGDGKFISKDMLADAKLYASIEPINPVIEEVVGPVLRDASLPARLLLHPRQVAANHKEFAPVFDTAIRQYEERDRIVSVLGELAKPYFDLPQRSKEVVNKIIEQGRLSRTVYKLKDFELGIPHHSGETIRPNDDEIAAYVALRKSFDEALTLFRDTMLEEYGFSELVGEKNAALKLLEMIASGQIEDSRIEWAKKVAVAINEIEQAKRTGYVPFTRYGQFVVAVKALPDGVSVTEDDELVLVHGIPENADEGSPEAKLIGIVTDLNGQYDAERDAWIVPESRNKVVRALERTLYATKVEVGSIKEWRSRGKDVTEIPEVKKAYDEVKAKYGDVENARIISFHITEKEKAKDANITAIDELAKIASVDTETWDEVRAKLQDAIKSRGFRRHFFGSDNTPGYSTDFERSIADYIIGMSGYLARRKHVKEFDDAIKRIKAPKLAAYADEYRQYVNSPADEFALVKQIGFLSYIAGTVATAATNLTQVPMLTVPTLAQFVPHHVAVRETARAWKDALAMFSPTATGLQMFDPAKVPADVGEAFMAAWNDQLFVPLETLDLMATASVKTVGGRTTMRVLNQTTQAIAYLFMFAERINRITTFIAAQRISRMPVAKQNMQRVTAGDAWAKFSIGGRKWNERSFAEWVVDESQYRMGKVNRPKLSRGVGSPLLQFKGYMMQTLEAGYRMASMHGPRGKASFLAAIAMMLMLGGLWGLPGLEDLRDIIEKFYKVATGKDLDLKTETRRIAAEMTGSATVGSAVAKGVPYATVGVDMSRVGMGNIIPDSPLQVFGIPADMAIGRPMRAAERAAAGNYYGAMTEMLPNFLKNPAVGLQWKFDGLRDRFGSRLMTPGEFDYGDVAIKSLGWTPTKVTNRRDYTYAESRAESGINELKRRYTNDLVRAYVREQQATTNAERKQYLEEQKAVLEAIAKHNAKASQEQMIKLDPDTLRKKAAAELLGGKAREGKERKFSRDAAQQRRELFQVP